MAVGVTGRRSLADHPARFVLVSFLGAILVGTSLLWLPWSTAEGRDTDLLTALFTATSAVCVTGLTVVDGSVHWTGFGQGVLLVLVQLGGLGFMTLASLIAMVVSHRLGLRMTLAATAERRTLNLGDVRRVLTGVALVTVVLESAVALVLIGRFRFVHDYPWDDALWHGVFHSVSAFNNAGFTLYGDSMVRFAGDWWLSGALMISVVIGGLGFPVLVDLYQRRRSGRRSWRHLSLHSRLTITASLGLIVAGFVAMLLFEWGNPDTFGTATSAQKGWHSLFGSVTARTAGFHLVDPAAMTDEGLLATMSLMFIGAGSAGTSGGIKVGTFAVLAMIVVAELRGDRDVAGSGRRIPGPVQRQAITVVVLAGAVVVTTTGFLLWLTEFGLRDTAFEAVSAFGTTGMSTGVTPHLPGSGRILLIVVMLIGRLGPVTLGTALVLRYRSTRIRLPEEAPLIG